MLIKANERLSRLMKADPRPKDQRVADSRLMDWRLRTTRVLLVKVDL